MEIRLFQSLNHQEFNLKVQLLMKSGSPIVPNPCATLVSKENKRETKAIVWTYMKWNPCNCIIMGLVLGYYLSKVTNRNTPCMSVM